MESSDEQVGVEIDNKRNVATIELRRPPNNYFDLDMVRRVADLIAELDGAPECRAIVLAAQGKHFCAGRDFSVPAKPGDVPRALYAEALRLFDGTKPIIAAVSGAAIGGGLGFAMAADFRVAGPSSRFAANFSRLGYFPGFGLTATLPRIIGHQRSLELLYLGRSVVGAELQHLGLCDRYAEDDDVRGEALKLALEIAASAPLSVSGIRAVLRGEMRALVQKATDEELGFQEVLRTSQDFKEAQLARKERRDPEFAGA